MTTPHPETLEAVIKAAPPIFVFGSNLRGAHGAGAALWARQYRGARYGQGEGRQGNSYALPTKDHAIRTLPLDQIEAYACRFLAYARANPDERFQLTPVGCGLAGYRPALIAPMFKDAPPNVELPAEFKAALSQPNPSDSSTEAPQP
jgi:hypothetical protein